MTSSCFFLSKRTVVFLCSYCLLTALQVYVFCFPFPCAADVYVLLYDYRSLMWMEKEGENILFSDVPDIQIVRQLDQQVLNYSVIQNFRLHRMKFGLFYDSSFKFPTPRFLKLVQFCSLVSFRLYSRKL